MVGVCFGSLALLAGLLSVFGLSWYRGKQNGRKQKKMTHYQEDASELTV
jgi:hypothetical protein